MDDDASPEVLETMEAAANIHVDDTITPDGGKLIVGQGYAADPATEWKIPVGWICLVFR